MSTSATALLDDLIHTFKGTKQINYDYINDCLLPSANNKQNPYSLQCFSWKTTTCFEPTRPDIVIITNEKRSKKVRRNVELSFVLNSADAISAEFKEACLMTNGMSCGRYKRIVGLFSDAS